jgi:hypothetical protein
MHVEEVLAGKTVVGIKVKSPTVWLEVQGGECIEITVYGDCCSEAFIDATRLIGTPTLTGESHEISMPAEATSQEFDELTTVFFVGDMGCVMMIHRNSSNGYYSNYLDVNVRGVPREDAEDGKNWLRKVEPRK